MSIARLAEIYDVSKRQVYRFMNEACLVLPIVAEKVNGETFYRLMPKE